MNGIVAVFSEVDCVLEMGQGAEQIFSGEEG